MEGSHCVLEATLTNKLDLQDVISVQPVLLNSSAVWSKGVLLGFSRWLTRKIWVDKVALVVVGHAVNTLSSSF